VNVPTSLFALALVLGAQDDASTPALTADHLSVLQWRNPGPTPMGGRITDLAVHPERPRIFYAASATGGLWKTTNNGTTFQPVFENEGSSSVGAVAVAPSTPDMIWVGTGEANARNSVSWGDGVYRSDDGGVTWSHRGLAESKHVGGIAIHPWDPDTVFVAAMGSTWGPNPERGLFRTRDGGETWRHVLFVDERTGCIDVLVDPDEPDVVFAATYERLRDELDGNDPAVRTGPGSGIWRSLDGGDSWERLQNGLPTVPIGRIGLDVFSADSSVLYAIIETERTGERGAPPRSEDRVSLGIKGRDHEEGGFLTESITEGESAAQAGLQVGDVITRVNDVEIDGRATLVATLRGFLPGDAAELVFRREGTEETARLTFLGRLLRGRARSFAGSQGGQVANAQDEQGPDGFESGGVFRTEDRGTTWTRVNSLDPRPFYYSQIRVNPTDANEVYVLGISVHRSQDGGKTFDEIARRTHPDHHALWIDPRDPEQVVLGNDGGVYVSWDHADTWDHLDVLPVSQFYNVGVDLREPYWVYGGLQDNGTWGGPSATRVGGVTTSDWIYINGGDGFHVAVDPTDPNVVYSESQNGMILRLDLRTGERGRVSRPSGSRNDRFNWNTPFLLSPHNPSIFFYAGNRVLRSIDRGETTVAISPDIARTEQGSATALAQSPRDADTLWVGTDDGALWQTFDGGREWLSLADRLPGVDRPLYVSDIELSAFDLKTAYVTLDGHRSDDYAPYVFVTENDGETWRSLAGGLPGEGSVRTIALDPVNPSLLYVGTETGCFVSVDAGEHWTPLGSGLPTVPVHDLVVHPRDADLVAGTHGRGIWIVDVAPLQGLVPDDLEGKPTLLPVQLVRTWSSLPGNTPSGERHFIAPNPPGGAAIYYFLPEKREGPVTLTVRDALGGVARTLEGPGEPGLQLVRWDLRRQRQGGRDRGARAGGGAPGGMRGGSATVGDYSVTLELGENSPVQAIHVLPDPQVYDRDAALGRDE